ncbi:hypothetical protein ACTWQF_36180 [Streptomyces sp. 8N114]|uniref:hypothetical protein n=1 Tax=Streptomyces sp. 8N114 TaxID=3457419 RepID=UPI003FD1F263
MGQVVHDPPQALFGREIGYQEAVGGAEFADQVSQTGLVAGDGRDAIASLASRRAKAWPIPALAPVTSARRAPGPA